MKAESSTLNINNYREGINNMKEEITVICREYNKYAEDLPTITYVVKRNATAKDLGYLDLRQRYNSELNYYICKVNSNTSDEQIINLAETSKFKSPLFIKL